MIKHVLTIACSITLCTTAPLNARAETLASETTDDPYALQVTQPDDMNLSCNGLHQEALLMRDIIQTTEELKNQAQMKEHGIKAAGAIGSFLIGSVTGGLGLAAAGFLANNEVESDAKSADAIQDKAEARRSLMVGLYNGKNCLGSIDYVLQDDYTSNNFDLAGLNNIEPASGDFENSAVRKKPRYND